VKKAGVKRASLPISIAGSMTCSKRARPDTEIPDDPKIDPGFSAQALGACCNTLIGSAYHLWN
jgi:hypothetical protein